MHRSLKLAAVTLAFAGIGTATAHAQQKPDEILALRKGVFEVVKSSFGPMSGFAQGKAPLDAARAAVLGARLSAVAPMVNEVFVPGTGMDKLADSKAKPDIWAKPDAFKEKAAAFEAAAAKLAEAAKAGNLEAIKTLAPEVGKTCKACHDDFKEK